MTIHPKILSVVLLCAGSIACEPQYAMAGPTECQDAITEYKSAMSDISTALQAYTACLSTSNGHDDCSSEFETLRSAQDDLESAVCEYESECN
jgi:hypothetical protein